VFFPLGLDNMIVKRVPAVSLVLAIACVLGYLAVLGGGDDILVTFGMVPAEGLGQIGWLTSMFLHVGIWHLLFNLLFFYLAGPCVEDAWGRGTFLALFVFGDVAANLTQYIIAPGSPLPTVGASGAIAACVGAMAIQFPHRKVRVAYWIWFRIGTFFIGVRWWAGFWIAKEVVNLALAESTEVAFGAHVGGFVFGVAMALVRRAIVGEPTDVQPAAKPMPAAKPALPELQPIAPPVQPVVPREPRPVEVAPVRKATPGERRTVPKAPKPRRRATPSTA